MSVIWPSTHNKDKLIVKIWKTRTVPMWELENVKQEMVKLNINILWVWETRWINGEITSDSHIYAKEERNESRLELISNKKRKSVLGYWQISDRSLPIKLVEKSFNTDIIAVYEPKPQSTKEEKA